jgi:formate hydrogenlyase subunit 3/multisubunit Na+/H+ antiporter MnhD subunit
LGHCGSWAFAADVWCVQVFAGLEASLGSLSWMLGLVSLGVILWGTGSGLGSIAGLGMRLLALLTAFALGMLLVLLAGDSVVLFIGWEVIGVASVLLVG